MRQLECCPGDKQTTLHMELPLTSNQIVLNGQTSMMDRHTTKNMHERFFYELAMHNSCMTYSASVHVPQSHMATKLHIKP